MDPHLLTLLLLLLLLLRQVRHAQRLWLRSLLLSVQRWLMLLLRPLLRRRRRQQHRWLPHRARGWATAAARRTL